MRAFAFPVSGLAAWNVAPCWIGLGTSDLFCLPQVYRSSLLGLLNTVHYQYSGRPTVLYSPSMNLR